MFRTFYLQEHLMHFSSTTGAVAACFFWVLATISTFAIAAIRLVNGSYGEALILALVCIFDVHFTQKALRGYRHRFYDIAYADVKQAFRQTLDTLVPRAGQLKLISGTTRVIVQRGIGRKYKNDFWVFLQEEAELINDDELNRTIVVPKYTYRVDHLLHYVGKSYKLVAFAINDDGEIVDDDDSHRSSRWREVFQDVRSELRFTRTVPEELRTASVEDLRELHAVLVDAQPEPASN